MAFALSAQLKSRLDEIVARYPERQAALLPVLNVVQQACGNQLPLEAMDAVAEYLGVAPTYIYEAVTFYTLYNTQPVGRCHLQVCTNLSCSLLGAERVVEYLSEKLGIGVGETTADRKFTLVEVECLASCGTAPMMQVNDEYVENLTREKIDQVIARYSKD
jgi:NADH-quinone oxidoreductase subunit E